MPKYARCRSRSYFCSGLHGCADCKWRARTNSRCENYPHWLKCFALQVDFGEWTGTTRRRVSVTGYVNAANAVTVRCDVAEAAEGEQRCNAPNRDLPFLSASNPRRRHPISVFSAAFGI